MGEAGKAPRDLHPRRYPERRTLPRPVQKTIDEFGGIQILVNNAAFQITPGKIDEWPSEDFERCLRTNVLAMFYLCKAAMPRMQPCSVVINTASIEAFDPSPVLVGYTITKAAIVNKSMPSHQGRCGRP